MKTLYGHLKKYIFQGLLAIIPIALSFFVLRFIYVVIDKRVTGMIDQFIGFSIPGLGIFLLLMLLYLVGLIASNVAGKQFINFIERVTNRIPIIRTTYQVGKQLSSTISLPEKHVFKRVVLVDYLMPGIWTIGFVTGTVVDRRNNNDPLLKVYIPTPPNPATGTIVIVRESQTRNPGWSIDEALRTVISGGIIGPEEIR